MPSSTTSSTVDLPATAGFDFKKISDVLGKNVDPEEVKLSQPSNVVPDSVRRLQDRAPLERAESAPPLEYEAVTAARNDYRSTSPVPARTSPPLSTATTFDYNADFSPPASVANAPDYSNEWATPAAPISATSQPTSTRAARGFPSHVLQSATNIFSKDLDEPSHFVGPVDDEDDEGGDIGGFGRESKDVATSDWSTYPDRKPKDDWALNNPW
jgi:hypothetical protein